jgi:hypothetical protein
MTPSQLFPHRNYNLMNLAQGTSGFWDYYYPSLHKNLSGVSKSSYKVLIWTWPVVKLSSDWARNWTHDLTIMKLMLYHWSQWCMLSHRFSVQGIKLMSPVAKPVVRCDHSGGQMWPQWWSDVTTVVLLLNIFVQAKAHHLPESFIQDVLQGWRVTPFTRHFVSII